MIEGKPHRWWLYSRNMRLFENGREIALLYRSHFGEKGKFVYEGRTYRIRRKGRFSLREQFLLEDEKGLIAAMESASEVFSGYFLHEADRVYSFHEAGLFSRPFGVECSSGAFILKDEERVIGVIDRSGHFFGIVIPFVRREVNAHLPDNMSLPVRIFCIFVAATVWDRD